MDNSIKKILWSQFAASIDMLKNAISQSPEGYFFMNRRFYYIVYHATVFLDYYLTVPPRDFAALLPFTFTEEDLRPAEAIDDLIPEKFYDPTELLAYIDQSREKCKNLIRGLTDAVEEERFTENDDPNPMDYPILEILLYNMRHTQHHVAQLNLMLRQDLGKHIDWVFHSNEHFL